MLMPDAAMWHQMVVSCELMFMALVIPGLRQPLQHSATTVADWSEHVDTVFTAKPNK